MNEQWAEGESAEEFESLVTQAKQDPELPEFDHLTSCGVGCFLGAVVPTALALALAFLRPDHVLDSVTWPAGPDDNFGPIGVAAAWLLSIPITAIFGALGWNIICRLIYTMRKRRSRK